MALSEPRAVARLRSERGFTLIDMLLVLGLIAILSALAVPGLTRARGAAQATSALSSLRVINSGQLSYAISCGLGFYAPDLPTLGVPPPGSDAPFVGPELTSAATLSKSGYEFELFGTSAPGAPATCNGLGAGGGAGAYKVRADPLDPSIGRYFGTNATGLLYEHTSSLFADMTELDPSAVGEIVR